MTVLETAYVRVVPQTDQFEPELRKRLSRIDARKDGQRLGSGVGSGLHDGLGRSLGKVTGLLAGAFTAAKIGGLFGDAVSEAREAAKVTRITENAIRATGGAANVTAGQVGRLAEAISNKTGIDDEAVQSSANLLLTFKNIRNEAGAGANVFDRATAAAQDLAAAGFGSADGAAKMLGKALNDPLKGLTALGRAGVTFTADQQKQIKALVETGDVLGAQKIILQEVESQVGGAAAAAADPMQKLGVIVGNLKERLGTALLPAITGVAEWLGPKLISGAEGVASFISKTLVPAFNALTGAFRDPDVTSEGFVGVMERIGSAARRIVDFIRADVLPGFRALVGAFRDPDVTSEGFVGFMERVGSAARATFDFLRFQALPVVLSLAGSLRDGLGAAIQFVREHLDFFVPFVAALVVGFTTFKVVSLAVTAALRAQAIATGLLNAVMAANPIGLVIVALAALVGGLVYAYKNSETFREVVDKAFKVVSSTAQWMWHNVLSPVLGFLWGRLRDVWTAAQEFSRIVAAAWEKVWTGAQWMWHNVLSPIFGFLGDRFRDAWLGAQEFARIVGAAWDDVKNAANTAWSWIRDNVIEPFKTGLGKIKEFIDGIKSGWETVKGVFSKVNPFGGQGGADASAALARLAPSTGAFPLPAGSYRVGVGLNGYPGHTGQDFPAPTGTPVFSTIAGMAKSIDLGDRSYGRYVSIMAANGLQSISAHLSRAVANGPVRPGSLIGYVGSTGNSTGPHLHQEYRLNGIVQDPRRYLKFDRGGWLPPGVSMTVNHTGRPERVLTADQERALTRPSVSIGTVYTVDVDGMVRTLRTAQRDAAVMAGLAGIAAGV